MSKANLDHFLSALDSPLPSTSATARHHDPRDDADNGDGSNLSLDLISPEPQNNFGCDVFEPGGRFNGAGPTEVLYSSDISNPVVHGSPHIFSEAAGSGSSHSGAGASGGAAAVTGAASSGLIINVTYDSSVAHAPADFKNVIAQVVQYYENQFTDPITVNINVGFGEVGGYTIGSGALGESITNLAYTSYQQIKNALTADATTAADHSAVASLTGDPTGGAQFLMATAEAKALGLMGASSSVDGYVGFSSQSGIFSYGGSVGPTQYDFYGVVAHEISEVMGRILLVGSALTGSPNYDPLDLFHYSAPGSHDLSGSTPGYFSVDGGTTNLHNFNANPSGDAGDWATSTSTPPDPDPFDAFATPGVAAPISQADLTALDVIGWNAVSSSSPPPSGPLPDLTVSSLSLHDTTLTLTISNISQTAAAAASTAGLYLSNDGDGTIDTSDILIATISVPALAANASASGSFTVPFPTNLTPGIYHLGVIADYSGQIAESSESNNWAPVSIPIYLGNNSANVLADTGTSPMEIIGLGGNDTLVGNAGHDTLIGGSGSDHFHFNSTANGGGNGNVIVDFTPGSDVLDFAHNSFGGLPTGTLSSTNFVANSTGPTNASQKFWFDTAHFTLYYDADGSGSSAHPIAMAQLENHATLSSANIHLV